MSFKLDLIAIVQIHQVVNETKRPIVLLAISLQTLNTAVGGIRQNIL